MASRIAVIGIIVEEPDSVKELNQILHEYGEYIIGRLGIPYRQREKSGVWQGFLQKQFAQKRQKTYNKRGIT